MGFQDRSGRESRDEARVEDAPQISVESPSPI